MLTFFINFVMSAYQPYRNLPPLAGICSLKDAMNPGLAIEQCVARLKRYHYAFKRLHQIFTSRLTAEPIYELKMAFSLHAHLCAEHVSALRKRVGEMREPPLGLEAVPDASLEIFFDEILDAPTTEELVLGIYEKAVPALDAALKHHLDDTNLLADQPSARLCKFALLELAEMQKFGEQAVVSLIDKDVRKNTTSWLMLLDNCLAAAGQLDGAAKREKLDNARPHPNPLPQEGRTGWTCERCELAASPSPRPSPPMGARERKKRLARHLVVTMQTHGAHPSPRGRRCPKGG